MSSTVKHIRSISLASKAGARKVSDNSPAFPSQPHPRTDNKVTEFKKASPVNKDQTANRSSALQDKDKASHFESLSKPADNTDQGAGSSDITNRHHFLKMAILISLSLWLLGSFIEYYQHDEAEFEIIPSSINDLLIRGYIALLLIVSGQLIDYKSKRSIDRSIIMNRLKNKADNISRAKKQWELVIDTLPQLVIAMDDSARITRVNRTVESWGIGKVNKVDGLSVSDFLRCLNNDGTEDAWMTEWPHIWQEIKNRDAIERKIEKKQTGKTYQYTLRKISDYDSNKDQCYAVLIIDDITTRQDIEVSLKTHALKLEKTVDNRTKELKQTNKKLEHELQVKQSANKALKKSQDCRLALLRDIFTTQEKERKRIACELHDSVGQSLGATKFKLEELLIGKDEVFNAEYDEFTDVVKNLQAIIHEVRHISMDLRPALLDDLGTLITLSWFCRKFGDTYTGVSIKQIINVVESDISEDKKVVIFRIVQEAMNN
ncbi:MAG TPA: hypothetical protein ENJ87_05835, partial [Gammaproteobacteria bacterium]|nr:hypothetical protein [Gammaproteobacteria bacterium]